jgi:hypothetical protein
MADDTKHNEPVGYKRPPVATQFKPGVSGNPCGRPKRVNGLKAELLDELGEIMRIREGDSELEISKARAIAKSLVRAAVDGNMRAATALLAFCAKGLGDAAEPQDHIAPEDADILEDYIGRELRRRANERDDVTTENQQSDSHHERDANNE